jgi:hypothetical protein
VAADPARIGVEFRAHRQLDEIVAGQLGVDRLERGGMDHVLGIVEQHRGEAAAAAGLVGAHRGVEPVEAIGLGGRAVAPMDHQSHPGIVSRAGAGRVQRRGIVGIAADIDPQGRLRPGLEHVGDGGGDHRAFLERRDQYRRRSGQRSLAVAGAQPPGFGPPGQPEPQPAEIERKLVDHADTEPECGKGEQLALERQQPVQRRKCL